MGAMVALQYVVENSATVASLTLITPPSLLGGGGTKGEDGTPNYADFSGAGAAGFPEAILQALRAKDRTTSSPFTARSFIRNLLVSPDIQLNAEFEEALIDDAFKAALGDDNFPGNSTQSLNWPYFAPGTRGVSNAVSSKYYSGVAAAFVALPSKPPVLWIRSAFDPLVSDNRALDIANFGLNGTIPGYPGLSVYPPQPEVTQTRRVLTRYASAGGRFEEKVYNGKGHSPYMYAPALFIADLKAFVTANAALAVR
jgi:pimeloyl-ACP methyl ester carboxylesterase